MKQLKTSRKTLEDTKKTVANTAGHYKTPQDSHENTAEH